MIYRLNQWRYTFNFTNLTLPDWKKSYLNTRRKLILELDELAN
jgi:hypothetical protein